MSKQIEKSVATQEAFKSLAAAVSASLKEALEVGRRYGRQQLSEELEADATRPILERRVEFVSDDKGHITGKIEREYQVRTRAEARRKEEPKQ